MAKKDTKPKAAIDFEKEELINKIEAECRKEIGN